MKKTLVLFLFLFSSISFAIATRYVDADGFKNPGRTKTWMLPTVGASTSNTLVGETTIQTLSNKIYQELVTAEQVDSATTGASQTLTSTSSLIKVTNASLTSITGITAGTPNKIIVLINGVGGSLEVINDSGTSANRIITGTGNNITMLNGSAMSLIYSASISKWVIYGGASGSGVALSVAEGGTGRSSLTEDAILVGNSTGAVQLIVPVSVGDVLSWNGTTWASTAAGSLNITNAATTYTALSTDNVIIADATAGAFSVSLPTASGISGKSYTIKKGDTTANEITVDPSALETIDGATTFALAYQHKVIEVVSDGSNWKTLNYGYSNIPGYTGQIDYFSVSYGTTNASTVCSGTPCFIDQIGTAVSSMTRSGTGAYTVNLARTYNKIKCGIVGSLIGDTPATYKNINCSNCTTFPITSYNIDAAPVALANTHGTFMCQGTY